jgi:hypothetical protein
MLVKIIEHAQVHYLLSFPKDSFEERIDLLRYNHDKQRTLNDLSAYLEGDIWMGVRTSGGL